MASAVSLLLSSPRPLHRAAPALLNPPVASHARLLTETARPRLRLIAPPRASNPNNNDNSGTVEALDRVVAAVAYLCPFLDGARHGRFLLAQFPVFSALPCSARSRLPRVSSTPRRSRPSFSSSPSTSPSCATSRPSPASSASTPCRPSRSTCCSSSPTSSRSHSRLPAAGLGSSSSRAWRAPSSSSCSSAWSTAGARACSGRRHGCPSSQMQPSAR